MKINKIPAPVIGNISVMLGLMLLALGMNQYLHIYYPEEFIEQETSVEKGMSELFLSEDKKYRYRINEQLGTVELVSLLTEDKAIVEVPSEVDGYMVTSIGEACFAYHGEIERIKIPDSINSVKLAAFASCPNLELIIVMGDITYIEEYAFSGFEGEIEIQKETNLYQYAKDNGIKVKIH